MPRIATVILAAVVFGLAGGAQAQSRDEAISRLESCIQDFSVMANRCGGRPLEAVVDLYLAGDAALLPLILRAHDIRFSGTETDPGVLYLQVFQHDPARFFAAAANLSDADRMGAISAFADSSADIPTDDLTLIRNLLSATVDPASTGVAGRLLHEVDVSNAYRLRSYFPPDIFEPNDAWLDDFIRRWYSGQLLALEEPALFSLKLPTDTSVYRFLWLRTFNDPVSVRLEIDQTGNGTATLHVADGSGGYRPGVTVTSRQRTVASSDVRAFLGLLQDADFWALPSKEPPNPNFITLDGARWIFEATRAGAYHLVDLHSPQGGPLRDAALLLLRVGGYEPAKDELY